MKLYRLQLCSLKTQKVTTKYCLLHSTGALVVVGSRKACVQIINLTEQTNNEDYLSTSIDSNIDQQQELQPESDRTNEPVQSINRPTETHRISSERQKHLSNARKQLSANGEGSNRLSEKLGDLDKQCKRNIEQNNRDIAQYKRDIEQNKREIEQGKRRIEILDRIDAEFARTFGDAYTKAGEIGGIDNVPTRIDYKTSDDGVYRIGNYRDSEDYPTIDI